MIRESQSADCDAVYSLICDMENHRLPYDKFVKIFEAQQADERYCCLVYEHDKVLGFINLRFEYQLHHAERIAEILELVVDSSCRSKGIGKKLLVQALSLSKENDCVQIEVACNQLREGAHRFYEREGMHNFHYKFSKSLVYADTPVNALGR